MLLASLPRPSCPVDPFPRCPFVRGSSSPSIDAGPRRNRPPRLSSLLVLMFLCMRRTTLIIISSVDDGRSHFREMLEHQTATDLHMYAPCRLLQSFLSTYPMWPTVVLMSCLLEIRSCIVMVHMLSPCLTPKILLMVCMRTVDTKFLTAHVVLEAIMPTIVVS